MCNVQVEKQLLGQQSQKNANWNVETCEHVSTYTRADIQSQYTFRKKINNLKFYIYFMYLISESTTWGFEGTMQCTRAGLLNNRVLYRIFFLGAQPPRPQVYTVSYTRACPGTCPGNLCHKSFVTYTDQSWFDIIYACKSWLCIYTFCSVHDTLA